MGAREETSVEKACVRAPEATRSSRKKKSTGAAARREAIDATISLPAALLLSDRVTGSERRCYKWKGFKSADFVLNSSRTGAAAAAHGILIR